MDQSKKRAAFDDITNQFGEPEGLATVSRVPSAPNWGPGGRNAWGCAPRGGAALWPDFPPPPTLSAAGGSLAAWGAGCAGMPTPSAPRSINSNWPACVGCQASRLVACCCEWHTLRPLPPQDELTLDLCASASSASFGYLQQHHQLQHPALYAQVRARAAAAAVAPASPDAGFRTVCTSATPQPWLPTHQSLSLLAAPAPLHHPHPTLIPTLLPRCRAGLMRPALCHARVLPGTAAAATRLPPRRLC